MKHIKEFEKFSFFDTLLYSEGTNYQTLVRNKILDFAKEVFKDSNIVPYFTKGVYHRVSFKITGEIKGYIDIKDGKKWVQIWCSFVNGDVIELVDFMKYIKNEIGKNSHFNNTTSEYRLYFEDIEKFLNELNIENYELYHVMKKYNL